MIVLAAKFTGKSEKRDEILRLAAAMQPPSRGERGCLTYSFYEQQPGRNQYLFLEEWENQAALDAHFQTPHFLDFMKHFPALIEDAPHIRVYDASGFRDL